MPCFRSKRVTLDVVPCTTEDGAKGIVGGVGRLENDGVDDGKNNPTRDGLHSAPGGVRPTDAGNIANRAGLHSAPLPPSDKTSDSAPLGDFIIENPGGQPDAAAIDEYLAGALGNGRIVKELRTSEWAARVAGLEALTQQVKRCAAEMLPEKATGQEEEGEAADERAALFRACVTVLARALTDKVVPVFLPALALLAEVYSPPFLGLGPARTHRHSRSSTLP